MLIFDAAEVGEPNLGYIVENRLLQAALLAAFVQRRRARSSARRSTGLQIGAGRVHGAHHRR